MQEIENLLQKTSRTFALTIPFLPEPTRSEVGIAYLLFRIIDTFEDADLWPPERRIETLRRFCGLLEREPAASEALSDECAAEPPLDHAGYKELLEKMPYVLGVFGSVRPPARAIIRRHVIRSAERMSSFVGRSDGAGKLSLLTLEDLSAYCYSVAGIVGEMLTELYLLGRPELDAVAPQLRASSAAFGEGLQLVNILKDAQRDEAEGRIYLPKLARLEEVFDLAEHDLLAASQFVETLRGAGAEAGLVAFNAVISKLALANLELLRTRGLGAKLSRLDVARIQAEVMRDIDDPSSPTVHLGG